ncbi:peptidyl-prolyl cis-trans isomerase FKBP62-like [Pseudomyrmex gracilis]|uniref:peptidyl-prolyl cis-trans isomerase FKBP62-like n=1 Tax=Pseudomyrmex gracilis TaxID=219809 RepID=UPI00099581E1|nr:peptidyl-prolyl cis-trans isomerase FKBP62-like [Pseudomyrmex gracilis]
MLQLWESSDKSVKKNVLKPGVFSKKPTECSTCNITIQKINVTGISKNDLKDKYYTEILDSECEKVLIIGEASAEIDKQIERAIQMMNIFEKSRITIIMKQSEDSNKSVTVEFEVTLTQCERQKSIWEWSAEEKYNLALKYKEQGVKLFKDSRIVDAFHKFSRGCKILITMEPIPDPDLDLNKQLESDINDLRLALYNNMATCQLSQKNYDHTVTLCSKILDKDKNNVKALYRRGVAYGSMKDNEKAVADLKVALTLEPNNQTVKEHFIIYNGKLQESIQKSNDMVRRMFKT